MFSAVLFAAAADIVKLHYHRQLNLLQERSVDMRWRTEKRS